MTAIKKLTEAVIPTIKATDKRREIPAGHGLYLTVQPSGHKSWALRYRRPGAGMAKIVLGPWPEIALKDARRKAYAALAAVGKDQDPAEAKAHERAAERRAAAQDAQGEIGKAIEKFSAWYAKKHRSAAAVEATLVRYALPAWSGRKLAEITASDVRRLVIKVADDGKPIMANRLLAALGVLFKWAARRELIPASPAIGVEKPGEERSRDRYLDDAELADLLRVLDRTEFPFGPILRLLLLTGLRRDEVAEATRDEIDLDKMLWTIPRERAKKNMSLTVPIVEPVADIIRSLPIIDGSDFLFPALRGGKGAVSGFSRAKERIDAALAKHRAERGAPPMQHWTIHDLRRSVATGLQRLGVRLEVTEQALGHTSGTRAGIVGIYQRFAYDEEKKAALEAWSRHLDGLRHPSKAKVIRLKR